MITKWEITQQQQKKTQQTKKKWKCGGVCCVVYILAECNYWTYEMKR